MKNRTSGNCFFLMLLGVGYCFARDVDTNYLTKLRTASPPITRDSLPSLDGNYTIDEVIEALRKRDAYEWVYGSLLIRLKDPLTIHKYAASYRESLGQDNIAYSAIKDAKSPWMIPEIIDVLLSGSPVSENFGDTQISLGPTGDTRILITHILATCPEFSADVRTWAATHLSWRNVDRQNELVSAIRDWWTTNEIHFRTENFEKVQVPIYHATGVTLAQPAQQLATPPAAIEPTLEPSAPVAPPPEPTPEPVKSSVAASIPTPAAAPAPAAKTHPAWWIAGLIILAAGLAFLARKQKPKS